MKTKHRLCPWCKDDKLSLVLRGVNLDYAYICCESCMAQGPSVRVIGTDKKTNAKYCEFYAWKVWDSI